MSSRTKLLLGVSVGIAVIAAVVFFVFFYQPTLSVVPQPETAEVLIDGQSVSKKTGIKLQPGTHTILVRAAGYLSSSQTLQLPISQVKTVEISLTPIPAVETVTTDVQFPVLAADEQKIFYLGKAGRQFLRASGVNTEGAAPTIRAISPDQFNQVTNVEWSADQNLVLLELSDGSTKIFDFTRYDFVAQDAASQEAGDFRSVAWHPTETDQFIAFVFGLNGERTVLKRTIVPTNHDERVVDFRGYPITNPKIYWAPNGKTAMVIDQAIYLVDVKLNTIKKLAGSDGAVDGRWSPNSEMILVEFAGDLAIGYPKSQKIEHLKIRSTANKSAWFQDSSSLLIATTSGSNIDNLSRIAIDDIGTKYAQEFTSDQPLSFENMLINQAGDLLWFTSGTNLHRLTLREAERDGN